MKFSGLDFVEPASVGAPLIDELFCRYLGQQLEDFSLPLYIVMEVSG
jgi:hypothetical protein